MCLFKVSSLAVLFTLTGFCSWAYQQPFEYAKEEKPALDSYTSRHRQALEAYERGRKLFDEMLYNGALVDFDRAILLQPDLRPAYFGRASCNEQLGNWMAALLDYTLLLELDGTQTDALFGRAVCNYRLKRYTSAVEDFTRLLQTPVKESQAIYFLSGSGKPEGQAGVEKVTTVGSHNDQLLNYRGLSYLKMADYKNALIDFQAAFTQQPLPEYLVNQALCHAETKQYEHALDVLALASSQFPEDEAISSFINTLPAEILSSNGALAIFNQLIASGNAPESAYTNRGFAKFIQGDYAQAQADYSEAIALNPGNPETYLNRAMALEKLGQYSQALADFEKAFELGNRSITLFNGKGNVLFRLQAYQKAIENYTISLHLDPNLARTWYNRGIAYHRLNLVNLACKDMETANTLGFQQAKTFLSQVCK